MKQATRLTLIAGLSGLTACGGLTAPGEIEVEAPSAALFARCDRPLLIPERAITQAEAERFWIRDRLALATCADRQAALAAYARGALDVFGVSHDE